MKDELTLIKTFGNNEMAAAVEALKRELPDIIENTKVIAKIRKASFDAHIDEGFTPEQALELCKSILL